MKVRLYRSEGVEEHLMERVLELLMRFPGPARFELADRVAPSIGHENWIDFNWRRPERKTDNWKKHVNKYESREMYDAHFYDRRPDRRERFVRWNIIFNVCEKLRQEDEVQGDDWVVLLTEQFNERNWFAAADPRNPRNCFVHTAEWDNFVEGDNIYPIAYEIAALLLQTSMYDDFYDLMDNVHYAPRGCMMDMCEEKTDISLKMRTADICQECQVRIRDRGINPSLVQQAFRIFKSIREEMLFKQNFTTLEMPSRIEIRGYNSDIFFTDMADLELQLTPKEKAVFLLFLNHPEGIALGAIEEHRDELIKRYSRLSNQDMLAAVHNTVDALIQRQNPMSIEISRINRKLKDVLGEELAKHYQVLGPNGGLKGIGLDRGMVLGIVHL